MRTEDVRFYTSLSESSRVATSFFMTSAIRTSAEIKLKKHRTALGCCDCMMAGLYVSSLSTYLEIGCAVDATRIRGRSVGVELDTEIERAS